MDTKNRPLSCGDQTAPECSGYLHPAYAHCFSEWGDPVGLSESGGWIISRSIPGSVERDAIGCYPIFCCEQWERLGADLKRLQDLVCVSMVTDPFGNYDIDLLQECFPDLAIPFKDHFIVDLSERPDRFVSPHHRRNVERGFRSVRVTRCEDPTQHSEEWIRLYEYLVERHSIRGIPAFSKSSLRQMLHVPGMEMLAASKDGQVVGIILWFVQGKVAYYHLGAFNEVGYRERASFALFWTALESFAREGIHWLNLGAAAGVRNTVTGLTRFKQGWSTGVKTVYFCGRILNPKTYAALIAQSGVAPGDYFPAYRKSQSG